jgi:apolipoprotein N-acyltransferase
VLVTTVEVPTGLDTIYARIGDVLGWASVLATLVLVVWSFRRSHRTKVAAPV